MKIVLIRHQKIDMKWNKKYDSKSFDNDCKRYNKSPIIKSEHEKIDSEEFIIYISELERTRQTANLLFGRKEFITLPLINEVPVISFKDSKRSLSTKIWKGIGRMQWFLNMKRQPETRKGTVK